MQRLMPRSGYNWSRPTEGMVTLLPNLLQNLSQREGFRPDNRLFCDRKFICFREKR
jgi:hypothetical protein